MADLTVIIGVLATAVSLAAAYLAYSIYSSYKNTLRGWLPITLAIILFVVVRAASALSDSDTLQISNDLRLTAELLNLAVVLLFAYGFWKMKNALEENERVERETMARMHEFEIRHRRHEDLRQKREKRLGKTR